MTIRLFKSVPTGTETEAIAHVLYSNWWGQGREVEEFEQEFAKSSGAKYAVAMNSCSAALDIAVQIAPLGDEVTVSALTFVSSALAILHAGKKVKFVDIDEHSRCTKKADIQVLFAGNDFGEGIIYDMAHSGGAKHKGLISVWSFHGVKNLPTGDGGMLTTNDVALYNRARALSWCGIDKSTYERSKGSYSWDYNINEVGQKANMNNIVAAIGLEQLKMLPERNKKRLQVFDWYDKHLDPRIERPFPSTTGHMYTIRVQKRDQLYDSLAKAGIEAGVHYKPLYYYPIFPMTPLPVTERTFREIITLPTHTDLTEEDVKTVCGVVNKHI